MTDFNPGEKVFFLIGVDDVHPESSVDGVDCGGDLEEGALGRVLDFARRYKEVKFTFFVTPDWEFKGTKEQLEYRWIRQGKSFKISNPEFEGFCALLRKLDSLGHEIGLHGLRHTGQAWGRLHEEFTGLPKERAEERIGLGIRIFAESRLPAPTSFCPPGWGISQALLEALRENGIPFVGGSFDPYSRLSSECQAFGLNGTSIIEPQDCHGVINIPRNVSISFESFRRIGFRLAFDYSKNRVEEIAKCGGLIGVHSHIENAYETVLGNGLTARNILTLERVIDRLESRYGNIEYSTFSRVGQEYLKLGVDTSL